MEEQLINLLNPGSKIRPFRCNDGSPMSGEVVAVTVTNQSLSFGYTKAVKLQDCLYCAYSLFAV